MALPLERERERERNVSPYLTPLHRCTRAQRCGGRVVVGIVARGEGAQLLIRELVEDSPSLAAFSTARSALRKDGLFFVVALAGPLTPELHSRASLVLDLSNP